MAIHWESAADVMRRFPAITVDPNVLYVDDDPIFTGAGTAAGIDVCLHIVRQVHGAAVASSIARKMVAHPHREGGQSQFATQSVPHVDSISKLHETLAFAQENLDTDFTVEEMATRALMSPRSFARHFRTATDSTPHAWLLSQRVARAQQLLESTDLTIDEVA